MNPRLRQLRGSDAVRALERVGFMVTRIKGSHHILVHPGDRSRRATIPIHAGQTLKLGTVRSILNQAKLTEDELVELL
jgi:predicted RNA binding protein YcfA (HicA-like mRNA interferase family)